MSPMNIREMVYRAEPYQIDIQVEARQEQNRLLVTGQLLDISRPEMVGLNLQVTLSNLRGDVITTVTNQLGKFSGELENSGDLELSFPGLSGKSIVILLRGAQEQSSGRKK